MARERLIDAQRFRQALNESGYDAVVAVSQHNVFYTSGAYVATQIWIRSRLGMSVLPKDGDGVLIVSIQEEGLARRESWIDDVRSYVEFAQSPMDFLASALQEKKLARGRVGLEMRYLTEAFYEELAGLLPRAIFEDCTTFFDQVRSVKTEGEIERFRQAARATEQAIAEGFQETRAGQTERALLDSILNKVNACGGYDIRSAILASGDQTAHAYPVASERVLEQGDLVRADIEGVFQGYGSHVARMAVVGRASEAQKDMYQRYREVQRGAIDYLRLGVRACDVYEHCVQAYSRLGIEYTWPYVGHGFGLAGQEPPMLEPHNTDELRPGMLVSIEPACFDTRMGGYRLGDLVLIVGDGAEMLTTLVDTQEMFVIQ